MRYTHLRAEDLVARLGKLRLTPLKSKSNPSENSTVQLTLDCPIQTRRILSPDARGARANKAANTAANDRPVNVHNDKT